MQQRLAVALPLLQPNMEEFVIVPFLQWLAQPIEFTQFIIEAIQKLDAEVKITWDFTDTQPAIDRLTPDQQQLAHAFIDFFEKKIDFPTLQQQLKNNTN